jgi:protein-tyrosine phosphatase
MLKYLIWMLVNASSCAGSDPCSASREAINVSPVSSIKPQYVHWPIVDESVPTEAAMDATLTDLETRLAQGT